MTHKEKTSLYDRPTCNVGNLLIVLVHVGAILAAIFHILELLGK